MLLLLSGMLLLLPCMLGLCLVPFSWNFSSALSPPQCISPPNLYPLHLIPPRDPVRKAPGPTAEAVAHCGSEHGAWHCMCWKAIWTAFVTLSVLQQNPWKIVPGRSLEGARMHMGAYACLTDAYENHTCGCIPRQMLLVYTHIYIYIYIYIFILTYIISYKLKALSGLLGFAQFIGASLSTR